MITDNLIDLLGKIDTSKSTTRSLVESREMLSHGLLKDVVSMLRCYFNLSDGYTITDNFLSGKQWFRLFGPDSHPIADLSQELEPAEEEPGVLPLFAIYVFSFDAYKNKSTKRWCHVELNKQRILVKCSVTEFWPPENNIDIVRDHYIFPNATAISTPSDLARFSYDFIVGNEIDI